MAYWSLVEAKPPLSSFVSSLGLALCERIRRPVFRPPPLPPVHSSHHGVANEPALALLRHGSCAPWAPMLENMPHENRPARPITGGAVAVPLLALVAVCPHSPHLSSLRLRARSHARRPLPKWAKSVNALGRPWVPPSIALYTCLSRNCNLSGFTFRWTRLQHPGYIAYQARHPCTSQRADDGCMLQCACSIRSREFGFLGDSAEAPPYQVCPSSHVRDARMNGEEQPACQDTGTDWECLSRPLLDCGDQAAGFTGGRLDWSCNHIIHSTRC